MGEVTVFGGTGFLGRRIVAALTAQGHDVRIGTRNPEGNAAGRAEGQGTRRLVKADLLDPASVQAAVAGAGAVVNAVGHYVEGAKRVAAAAREAGVSRLVHLSGIGSDPAADSPYIRSRGRGEDAVRTAFPDATIFRPSAMFANQEGLAAALGALVRSAPVILLFGQGRTRLQPVHADDVATAAARVLDQQWTVGRVLEFGGPEVFTYRDLIERVMQLTGRRRLLLPMPFFVWQSVARAVSPMSSPPLTEGQVALMRTDNVPSRDAPGLARLGILPQPFEEALLRRSH